MKKQIVFISDSEASVTKAFKKQACIFGTDEFKLWREYLLHCPNAKMVTKSINKNPNKKTNRNKKYDNMAEFISTLPNSEKLMEQFEVIKHRSKIQNHPYGYVLDWFEAHVEPLGNFETFIVDQAAKAEADTSAAA